MRLLHTADWHLGKKLRDRSRLSEQARALEQITDAARSEQVDAVLVAGDIYESRMPPSEAEELVGEFLARLCDARIACVMIAGNHDDPKRLGALDRVLENLRLHVRTEVRPADQGGVVEVPSRDGSQRALVATLPFVEQRKIVDACMVMGPDEKWYEAYSDRIAQVLARLARSFRPDAVNVVLAHLLVSGAMFGTGVRQLHLGEIYGITPERLPDNAHYIALGHLHRPQEIRGAPSRTAYSGSLIELDFGEREQDKRVVLVEAGPGRPAKLTDVPLTAGRRLRDVSGTLAQLDALAPELGDAFLRVTVQVPERTPGIEDKVRAALPHALDVKQEWPRTAPELEAAGSPRSTDPKDLFAAFYRRTNGTEVPERLQELFAEVLQQARQEDGK